MIIDYFRDIVFGQPWFLLLLLLIPVMIFWEFTRGKKSVSAIKMSTTGRIKNTRSVKNLFVHFPLIFRVLALICLILALARPQLQYSEQHKEGEGIDIILTIDVSGSMTAQDFTPNRMEAAKNVALEFIDNRQSDRIGIVIFAGESFTQCPLTTDYYVLKSQVKQIRNGLLEDGTSIGSGLATSVDRLRDSKSKSKVVILLTDGVNNGGLIDPSTAKEIAKAFQVKVYTIGVGTDGFAPTPVTTPLGVVMQNEKVMIDEVLLKEIASETGGRYYRATDNESLENIYKEINLLEKSKVEVTTYQRYIEKFYIFVFLAMGFLFIEIFLRYTLFRKFP